MEPIIPLRMLIERGFKVNWSSSGCTIRLEKGRPLACWLRNGCPVMERGSALHLLSILEAEKDQGLGGRRLLVEGVVPYGAGWGVEAHADP